MPEENNNTVQRTGPYEWVVGKITDALKPSLHKVTHRFIDKSIAKEAPDNPRYASMIEFEVRRRGDGAGLTQDVAEPIVWIGVKTMAALAIAAAAETVKNKTLKVAGLASSLTIVANQLVEAFRLLPRYRAGLQGSLEMAKDRWHSIETTGIDPFSQQQVSGKESAGDGKKHLDQMHVEANGTGRFVGDHLKKGPVEPSSLVEHATRAPAGTERTL